MYMYTYYAYYISVSFLDSELLKVIGGVSLFIYQEPFYFKTDTVLSTWVLF